ncbi:TPA: DUF3265 domain-containing protein [Vibrio vulnificus]|nr:DUF3265 domain-containing protein [Vibrio vulnificus]HAS6034191.1 DUF3265 domain-containing protein [Vibrio vulnificus]
MTKRLSGIWHAWHFQFALSLVVTALCGSFCIACLHPLTRRYVLKESKVFGLFKKKPEIESKAELSQETSPFEILLPDEKLNGEVPDLRIASKVLDILRSSGQEVQSLEIFEGMPVVNSNNPQLKEFAFVVNGAKQTTALKTQIEFMAYPAVKEGSIGVLCCLVHGILHEFHITNRGGGATINYQFSKVVPQKT